MNAILSFIGAASLSDAEYAAVNTALGGVQIYDATTYVALLAVLDAREQVSGVRDRLRYYFLARNVSVGSVTVNPSNIFVGAVLED